MFDLNSIVQASHDGDGIGSLARQFDLTDEQARQAVESLLPALSIGLRQQIQAGGLPQLLGHLATRQNTAAFESAEAAESDETVNSGTDVVNQLFGGEDVAGQVAGQAASHSGLSANLMQAMLPVVAAIVMGGLCKSIAAKGGLGGIFGQAPAAPAPTPTPAPAPGGGDIGDILGQMTGQRAAPPAPSRDSGGGIGDILGQITGQAAPTAPPRQGGGDIMGGVPGGQGGQAAAGQGGGLGDLLGGLLGGALAGQAAQHGGGLGDILGQLAGAQRGQGAAPPAGAGGLGDILGGLLGGSRPGQAAPQGGGGLGGGLGGLLGGLLGGGAGKPGGGIDPAQIQAGLQQLNNMFGHGANVSPGHQSSLESILGGLLGGKR